MIIKAIKRNRCQNFQNTYIFRPEINTSISLFSKSLIKKSCVANKKINGNISNIRSGEFKIDNSKEMTCKHQFL